MLLHHHVAWTVLLPLLLLSWSWVPVSGSCACSAPPSGGSVNCSWCSLRGIPALPAHTAELHLRGNLLSTVTPGRLDGLPRLRLLDLSENPLHCGCSIQYLRLWLLRNPGAVRAPATCATPPALAGRAVASLGEGEFRGCAGDPCPGAVYDAVACAALAVVAALLVWCLRLAKGLSFTLGIGERHGGLGAEPLRPLRPKKRRPGGQGPGRGELERPLLDMDILPQIIDTLHRQHNVKIKEM